MTTRQRRYHPKQTDPDVRRRFAIDNETRKRVREVMDAVRERQRQERIKGVSPGSYRGLNG